MSTNKSSGVGLALGSTVRIKDYSGPLARIIELRGPLGPDGAEVYRVAIPQNPGFSLVELLGDQLEPASRGPRKVAAPGSKRAIGLKKVGQPEMKPGLFKRKTLRKPRRKPQGVD